MKNKMIQIQKVKDKVLNLKDSPFYKFRIKNKYQPVLGEGNLNSKIMFVGEAPGEKEAIQGKPFVGLAGKLLDTLLETAELKRNDIYITSVVLDRPPGNKTPSKKESNDYVPFLFEQINIIKPKIIVLLGKIAIETVFQHFGIRKVESLNKIHGKTYKVKADYGNIKLIPFYHPAAAFYNRKLMDVMEKDFKKLKSI